MAEAFDLSPAQKRIWSLQGEDRELRSEIALSFPSRIEKEHLHSALENLVKRHETLRTVYETPAGLSIPFQVIRDEPSFLLVEERAKEIGEAWVEKVFSEASSQGIDLKDGPALRALLMQSGDASAVVLTLPAICGDRVTMFNLASELSCELSGARCSTDVVQYADYAGWHNELLAGSEDEPGKLYWDTQVFSGRPTTIARRTSHRIDGHRIGKVSRLLSRPRMPLTSRGETEAGAFLLSCWFATLWRVLGDEEIALGLVVDGRGDEELRGSLGAFARTLPISYKFSSPLEFADLLDSIDQRMQQVREWQEYYQWRSESEEEDETWRHFPICFEFEDPPPELEGVPGASILEYYSNAEIWDVKLVGCPVGEDLRVTLYFGRQRLDDADAGRLVDRLLGTARQALGRPEVQCSRLELLTETERQELDREWSAESPESSAVSWVQDRVDEVTLRAFERIAVIDGSEHLSFGKSCELAGSLAAVLAEHGTRPGSVVALLLPRGHRLVLAILAVLRSGGAYVALDVEDPEPRLEYMTKDSGATCVLTTRAYAPLAGRLDARPIFMDSIDRSAGFPKTDIVDSSLAYLAYTSGSTGAPKAILATHGGVANYASYLSATCEFHGGGAVLQVARPSFDASVREIFGALTNGATLCLTGQVDPRDPARLVRRAAELRTTHVLSFVPSTLRLFLAQCREQEAPPPPLRLVMVSGEELRPEDVAEFRKVFADSVELRNQYGPTESTMTSSYYRTGTVEGDGAPLPIGQPIGGARFVVVHPGLTLQPPEVPGELLIGGRGLSQGYHRRPGLTAERFLPDPFSPDPGSRLYRTGDRVIRYRSGIYGFLGRLDHQIKLHGLRIEPGEIESLLRRHPSVREAVVVARLNDRQNRSLVAYVTSRLKDSPLGAELRELLRSELPAALVPAALVVLRSFPRTPNGKIDRRALPAPEEQEAPGESGTAPLTEVQLLLADIWREIIGVEEVSLSDSFFERGGHSLMAVQVVSRIRQALDVEIPLRKIFEVPRLGPLAAFIEREMRAAAGFELPSISPLPPGSLRPLSSPQQRLWFLAQLEPGRVADNMVRALRFRGRICRPTLERCFTQVLARHESLRTNFSGAERPVQVVHEPWAWQIPLVDLSRLEEEPREAVARKLAVSEGFRAFDLERDVLWRTLLIRMDPTNHVGIFVMHHIISDQWSVGILISEVSILYHAIQSGTPAGLPELPIQYADFAAWEHRWLESEVVERQLAYWRRHLAGEIPRLEFLSCSSYDGQARYHTFIFPEGMAQQLRALARQEGATLFMLLLAALNVLLGRYSGRQDLVIGTDTANRNSAETERLIGFFVNLLVLRTDISGSPRFRELLRRVKRTCLDAYTHQTIPFDRIVQDLKPDREKDRLPFFDLLFVFQNAPQHLLDIPGLRAEYFPLEYGHARFPLVLTLHETGVEMTGRWTFDAALAGTLNPVRMGEHYVHLLQNIVENPESRIHELEIEPEAEKKQTAREHRQRAKSSFAKFKTAGANPMRKVTG